MKKNLMAYIFCLIFAFSPILIFAEGVSEPVGVTQQTRRPQYGLKSDNYIEMYKRLLKLGFEFDRDQYGIATDNVIKEIKYFLGYSDENKDIDYDLWYYICKNENTTVLENIKTVLSNQKMKLEKSKDLMGSSDQAFVYFILENKKRSIKRIEYEHQSQFLTRKLICYFVNENRYIIVVEDNYRFADAPPPDVDVITNKKSVFYVPDSNYLIINQIPIYEVTNGKISRSNDRENIVLVNEIIKKFRSQYR